MKLSPLTLFRYVVSRLRSEGGLDFYHKGVCATIQLLLTIGAVYVAWSLFGVQQDTAKRARDEIETRITKVDEQRKKADFYFFSTLEHIHYLQRQNRIGTGAVAGELSVVARILSRNKALAPEERQFLKTTAEIQECQKLLLLAQMERQEQIDGKYKQTLIGHQMAANQAEIIADMFKKNQIEQITYDKGLDAQILATLQKLDALQKEHLKEFDKLPDEMAP